MRGRDVRGRDERKGAGEEEWEHVYRWEGWDMQEGYHHPDKPSKGHQDCDGHEGGAEEEGVHHRRRREAGGGGCTTAEGGPVR